MPDSLTGEAIDPKPPERKAAAPHREDKTVLTPLVEDRGYPSRPDRTATKLPRIALGGL